MALSSDERDAQIRFARDMARQETRQGGKPDEPLSVEQFAHYLRKSLDKLEGFALGLKGKPRWGFVQNMVDNLRGLLKRLETGQEVVDADAVRQDQGG